MGDAKGALSRSANGAPYSKGRLVRQLIFATVLGGLVFAALALYGDLRSLRDLTRGWTWWSILAALAFSSGALSCRFYRWHLYLRKLGFAVPFTTSLLIFAAGLAMGVTPSRAGEVLKSFLLFEHTGIPVQHSVPIVVAERLTDLIAMVLATAALSGMFPGAGATAVIGGIIAAAVLMVCARREIGEAALRLIEKLPVLSRVGPTLRQALDRLGQTAKPAILTKAVVLACLSFLCDGAVLLVLARASGINGITLPAGTFVYTAAMLAGGIAMTPGGLGVSEAGMIVLLVHLGIASLGSSAAASLTIIVRLVTLWWSVLLGLVALLILRRSARIRT
jgi:glycosyltransferase 2 family protein